MNVKRIDRSRKSEIKPYLELPFRLGRADPLWFPALRSSITFDLSSSHPFHQHSTAAFFTTGDPSQPTGRIAVLENRNFNAYQNSQTAFFTHFECAENPAAARALFEAANTWAKERGLRQLVGPVGFLQTDARGMMISGFGKMTSFAIPYSPPYYAKLLGMVGFTKQYDYLSGELPIGFRISERVEKMAQRVMERSELELRRGTSRKTLRRMARHLLDVYKESGAAAPLYYPLTSAEEKCILDQLAQTAHPNLIHWLETNGEVCGIHIALPNYVEALRRARGNQLARMAAFLRQRTQPREINITSAYLRPEYQNRGLILVLTTACQQAALKLGAQCGLLGPIHEQNRPMLTIMKKSGVVFDINHRIFEREIV